MRFITGAISSLLLAAASPVSAQTTSNSLTGTWVSKSKDVVTGPGFYDPVNEKFIEPQLTGISYSFTDDGWYEEAYYRAVANPTNPKCPQGIMQWQHGKYSVNATGSLILTPVESDGRQQISDPCSYKYSSYERYKQKEVFKSYAVSLDKFHNVQKLILYQFNGAPMQPLYMAYNPPQMLPTMALNPTSSASQVPNAAASSASVARKEKRDAIEQRSLGKQALHFGGTANPDWFWYAGLGLTSLGLAMYCYNG